jgi:hypothetical protein
MQTVPDLIGFPGMDASGKLNRAAKMRSNKSILKATIGAPIPREATGAVIRDMFLADGIHIITRGALRNLKHLFPRPKMGRA